MEIKLYTKSIGNSRVLLISPVYPTKGEYPITDKEFTLHSSRIVTSKGYLQALKAFLVQDLHLSKIGGASYRFEDSKFDEVIKDIAMWTSGYIACSCV